MSPPAEVLLLGDPRLRRVASRVDDLASPAFAQDVRRLHETLAAFRAARGFGRAIAAPQIGMARRFIALHLAGRSLTVVNPEITWTSPETFTMWDDCMSFPSLLVRVRRALSISIRYVDERAEAHVWERMDQATAELFQHEIDHLDGVLAVDRAEGRDALAMRERFEAMPEHFRAQVDYVIGG
jgi:peptide deformylase